MQKKENESTPLFVRNDSRIITIVDSEVGSLSHTFKIDDDGRVTLLEGHRRLTPSSQGLTFLTASTIEDVEKLITVLLLLKREIESASRPS